MSHVVLAVYPERGSEVHYDGRSIYLHITDKALHDAYMRKLQQEVLADLEND